MAERVTIVKKVVQPAETVTVGLVEEVNGESNIPADWAAVFIDKLHAREH